MLSLAKKRIVSLVCVCVCLMSMTIVSNAAAILPEDDIYEPMMENIIDASCTLAVRNGEASANASVSGKKGTTKCEITLSIQEKVGTRWVTIDSWSTTVADRDASIGKSVDAETGHVYRAQATVKVWLGGVAESKTITTSSKTA